MIIVPLKIMTSEGDIDFYGHGIIPISSEDGKSRIAISSAEMKDNQARICELKFYVLGKQYWKEVLKKENLSAKEICKKWFEIKKEDKKE